MQYCTRRTLACFAASLIFLSGTLRAQSVEPAGYDPVEFHRIELGMAKFLTGGFQSANGTPVISTIAGTLSATSVRSLLGTPRAVYLREYFALDEKGVLHLLLVPKTADNHDIILPRITDADGSMLSEATARRWIQNYAKSSLFARYGSVYASSIHKQAVLAVIEKNKAAAVRFYFALELDNRMGVVLSGVSSATRADNAIETSEYIANKTCCRENDPQRGELAQ